jgi:hypothetical protein
MDNIINKVILSLSKKKDILLFNSHDIIALSMEIIESFNGLVGSLKSQVVKDILLEILNKNPLNLYDNTIKDIQIIIDNNLLQQTIDIIHKASSGNYDISIIKPPTKTFYCSINTGPHILARQSYINNQQ